MTPFEKFKIRSDELSGKATPGLWDNGAGDVELPQEPTMDDVKLISFRQDSHNALVRCLEKAIRFVSEQTKAHACNCNHHLIAIEVDEEIQSEFEKLGGGDE